MAGGPADLALVRRDFVRVVQSHQQLTLPAGVAVVAGAAVIIDPQTGTWALADADAPPTTRVFGLATRSAQVGEGLTAIRVGILDGFALDTLDYDQDVFLSSTAGAIADAAAGPGALPIGRVVPGTSSALGVAFDKLLWVDCAQAVIVVPGPPG